MRHAVRAAVLTLTLGLVPAVLAPSGAGHAAAHHHPAHHHPAHHHPAHHHPAATGPVVRKVRPASGPAAGGATVVVKGANLSGATKVLFGRAKGKHVKVKSAHKLTVVAPAHTAGRVDVRVVTGHGTSPKSKKDRYTFVAAPVVTAVSPATGGTVGGVRVTVTGAHLDGTTVVTFGGAPGTALSVTSPSSLTVTAPPHAAGVVDVRVTTAVGGTSVVSAGDHFTYLPSGPVVTAPLPPDASAQGELGFRDLDCAGPMTCVAVGGYGTGPLTGRPLVERLAGGGWAATSPPLPADASAGQGDSSLRSVSCPTASFCVAVGGYTRSSNATGPLVEMWDGSRWTVAPIGLPPGATYARFEGVSCASSAWCVAVGTVVVADSEPFVAAFNGTTWATDRPGGTSGATAGRLVAVDCSAVHACGVAGTEKDSLGYSRGLVGRLTGGGGLTWSPAEVVPGDVLVNGAVDLVDVSCPDVAAHYGCTSTGFYDTNAVLGSQKMVVTHFGGDGAGATYGGFGPVGQVSAFGEHLACWNPAACVVSGSYTTGLTGPKFGLLATVSDTGFTPYTVPLPPGVTGAESTTTGVTCTSSAACVATGVYWTSPIHDAGMLVQLSGPNLTSASTGTPGGATSAVLDTIALDTDSTAVAVGGYTAADGSQQGLLLSGLPVPAPPP